MEKNVLKLELPTATPEMIIREGNAPAINEPIPHSYNGTITSANNYLKRNRMQAIASVTVVEVDVDAGTIELFVNKSDKLAAVVTGKIKPSPILEAFKINTQTKFSAKELTNHLRMNKIYFADKDECFKVLEGLGKYKATITSIIEESNNLKGDKKASLETKLSHELKLEFVVMLPMFKGGAPMSAPVEIMCDITDGDVRFWLESVSIEALKVAERERLIKAEVAQLEDYYAIIYK